MQSQLYTSACFKTNKESFGEWKITFADFEVKNGKKLALETVLTDKDDLCSGQCLDYIFLFTPSSVQKRRNSF